MSIGNSTQSTPNNGEKKVYLPIPKAAYTVKMTKCTEKATKAGNGAYLDVTFEVVEGDHSKRLIFEKFMIDHPSEKVVQIGEERLSKFLKAVGVRNGLAGLDGDTNKVSEHLNKLVIGNVGIEAGTNGYGDRNKITSFSMR